MENLANLSVVRGILQRHGTTLTKTLGQNFLINPSVAPRIARQGGAEGRCVLEIGTGVGVLTSELARLAKKVVAVEIDRRLFPILEETVGGYSNLKLVEGDILKIPLGAILEKEFAGEKAVVCANLPYYITSPILMYLLESRFPIASITAMVQKEAAERICARPGSRTAGAISLACWYYARPEILFSVSRGSFYPAPSVDSVVVRLTIRQTPAVAVSDEKELFGLIRAGFSQRRKMLVNPLASYWNCSKEVCRNRLERARIPLTARAEELKLEQFARLAETTREETESLHSF